MQLSNWSYSRYSTWKKCPAILRFQAEATVEIPSHPAAQRGRDLHSAVEKYLRVDTKELPHELEYYRAFFDALIEQNAQPELQIALDEDWNIVEWDAPNRWLRLILDCVVDFDDYAIIYDWKTGNEYGDHRDQREIYAAAYASVRDIDTIKVFHTYFDKKLNTISIFDLKLLLSIREQWKKRVIPMLEDTRFLPNPGFHCRSCHFRRDNGGPCQF